MARVLNPRKATCPELFGSSPKRLRKRCSQASRVVRRSSQGAHREREEPTTMIEPIDERLLRCPDVMARTGLSRTRLYLAVQEGRFPRPVRIGSKAVAWRLSDILAWMASREPAGGAGKASEAAQ